MQFWYLVSMQQISGLEVYFRNGADNLTYNRVKPIDKFLSTLAICLSIGDVFSKLSVLRIIHIRYRCLKLNLLLLKTLRLLLKKLKLIIKPQSEALVYIYNTTSNRKTGYVVSYKLRNKRKIQRIEVKQMPINIKYL